MNCLLIKNGFVVNEGCVNRQDILVKDGKIVEIGENIHPQQDCEIYDADKKFVLPGVIDTHVHFREPGLTAKADIFTESRAAAAGGVTSFFDMPNTVPQTVSIDEWKLKNKTASEKSLINYAFYIGATNDNINHLVKAEDYNVAGIKLFYGSSTGNMLVNRLDIIREIFRETSLPIVIHSEDNDIISRNARKFKDFAYPTASLHPQIRSEEACYTATSALIKLARELNRKIHFLHISTKRELDLFSSGNVSEKLVTAEVTPNHLFFSGNDYERLGNKIKCNPAIKSPTDMNALLEALNNNLIDTVATDHAPHLLSEKQKPYFDAPSGIPSIQHSLNILLDFVKDKKLTLERVVEVTSHNPAKIFGIAKRGFIRKGYFADFTVVDMDAETLVRSGDLLYKCKWSPLEGHRFKNKILATIVNGKIVYKDGKIIEKNIAMPIEFER